MCEVILEKRGMSQFIVIQYLVATYKEKQDWIYYTKIIISYVI